MCPVCIATAAAIATGASGTSMLALLAATTFRKKKSPESSPLNTPAKEDRNG